MLQSALVPS